MPQQQRTHLGRLTTLSIASSTDRSLPKVPKISRTCASVTLRDRWPTCSRLGPPSGALASAAGAAPAGGAAAALPRSSVSMGAGLPASEGRRSGERRRPRGGERDRDGLRLEVEPLDRLLLLVPLEELEVPLEELEPLVELDDRERERSGMAACVMACGRGGGGGSSVVGRAEGRGGKSRVGPPPWGAGARPGRPDGWRNSPGSGLAPRRRARRSNVRCPRGRSPWSSSFTL